MHYKIMLVLAVRRGVILYFIIKKCCLPELQLLIYFAMVTLTCDAMMCNVRWRICRGKHCMFTKL